MNKIKNLVLGIGIIIVFALALWQGIEAFYPSPQYNDFCQEFIERPRVTGEEINQSLCEEQGGVWRNNYCDYYYECQQDYNQARDQHAKVVFLISIIVALIAIIVGYFVLSIEPVGSALIGSGIWSIFWGTLINWSNFSGV